MSRLLALGSLLAIVSVSASGLASPNFPDAVAEVFEAECAPSCTLCHLTNPGRRGTGVQPFALRLLSARLPGSSTAIMGGEDDATVRRYMTVMKDGTDTNMDGVDEIAPTDTDGDMMIDADELAAGINPNPGDAELCEVTYGCGARVAPQQPAKLGWLASVLVVAGLALLGLRARKRA